MDLERTKSKYCLFDISCNGNILKRKCVLWKILEDIVKSNEFYGVSIQAANARGSYYDKSNLQKSNTSYKSLIQCLKDSTVSLSIIRRDVLRNIGLFERTESIPLLLEQMKHKNYYV